MARAWRRRKLFKRNDAERLAQIKSVMAMTEKKIDVPRAPRRAAADVIGLGAEMGWLHEGSTQAVSW